MNMAAGKNGRSVVGKDVRVEIDVHKGSRRVTVRTDDKEIFKGYVPGQHHAPAALRMPFRKPLLAIVA